MPSSITGGPVAIQSRRVTLTDAEIKALPTTPIEIIPAQGAGKLLYPIGAAYHLNWVADYGNIDTDAQLRLIVNTTDFLLPLRQDTLSQVSALLAGGGPDGTDAFTSPQFIKKSGADWFSGFANLYDSDVVNKAVFLAADNSGAGNFDGGNAGNSLLLEVLYTIIDV